MIVAFWSPMHGKGTTSNCIGISSIAALGDKKRFYLLQNHPRMNRLHESLAGELDSDLETGFDSLSRIFKTGKYNRQVFEDTCTTYLSGRMNVLPGTGRKKSTGEADDALILQIAGLADEIYDYVVIDCNSGLANKSTCGLLKMADRIVVSMTQEMEVVKELKNGLGDGHLGKAVFLINKNDINSKYTVKNIIKRYPFLKDRPVFTVPYNSAFFDAKNDGKVLEFFNQNYECPKKDNNFALIASLKKAADMIFKEGER